MFFERRKPNIDLLELDNEVDSPLPFTPITDEARGKLECWGVPDDYIERLRWLGAFFCYERCPQKAARVARNNGLLFKHKDEDVVILPNFIDGETRLDGECGGIASQFIRALNFSGFLYELNALLTERYMPVILPIYSIGKSRTHYNTEGAQHVWTGLIPEGKSLGCQVVVDASFQEISNLGENMYRLEKSVVNPPHIWVEDVASVPIAEFDIGEGRNNFAGIAVEVLGVSFDKRFSYGLGFFRQIEKGGIRPYITLVRESGGPSTTKCLSGDDGECVWLGQTSDIDDYHKKEVEQMLENLKAMRIVADQRKAERMIRRSSRVCLSPTI